MLELRTKNCDQFWLLRNESIDFAYQASYLIFHSVLWLRTQNCLC